MRRKQMMIAMGAVTLSLILGTAPLVQTGLAAQGERAYEQESEKRGKSVEASTVDLSKKGSITIRKYDITSAEAAGDYKQGQDEADGGQNTRQNRLCQITAWKAYSFPVCGSEMWKRTWCIVMQRHWWN
mgnify:CR=1 FL=1